MPVAMLAGKGFLPGMSQLMSLQVAIELVTLVASVALVGSGIAMGQ